MPRNDLTLPRQVIDAIREHIEQAIEQAESGYASAQEAEDAVTGALGEALRTKLEQVVSVTEGPIQGTWRWSITYSKFGSGALDSTESIVGADGILEIKVGMAELDQQKSALFQAKNTLRKDPNLVAQAAKMSLWREAAFVISYSPTGYKAYLLDDVLLAKGSLMHANNGIPLAHFIVDTFIGCEIGSFELYYDKIERRLYWTREKLSQKETWAERRVWADFSPKHLIHIDVIPPNWRWSKATEISLDTIHRSRLTFTPQELFGIEPPFTTAELKRRRAMLLRAYHSDNSYHLKDNLRSMLDARIIEINDAFEKLLPLAASKKQPPETQHSKEREASAGLAEPRSPTVNEFIKKRKRKRVKVRKN